MNLRKIIDAFIAVAIITVILLYVNPLLVSAIGVAGTVVAEVLMVAVAVGAVLLRRDSIQENFSLRMPSVKSFFGALLLVMGANALQNAASFFAVALTDSVWTGDTLFLEQMFGDVDPFVTLVVVALVPAICEELVFRGFLLNSFKTKKGYIPAVIITALIFAAIHLDLYKFFPLLIMGLTYGYIASVTGSFLLGAIFHFINNAFGVISFYASRSSVQEALTVDISTKVYAYYGIAVIGVGAIFIYYGIMSLSGKQKIRKVTRLIWIFSAIVFVIGIGGVTASVADELVSTPYELEYIDKIREDVQFTESFDIGSYSIASVNAKVLCNPSVNCDIVITDPEGKEIYSYDDRGDGTIELLPGSYNVSCSFDTEEGNTVAYDVIVRVSVACVSVEAETGIDTAQA